MEPYKEIQRFRQPWIWLGLTIPGLVTTTLFGSGIYLQVIRGRPFGNNPLSDRGLIVVASLVTLLFLMLILLFALAKLTTVIDRQGIRYRFFPFHLREKQIWWRDVQEFDVIKYDPVRDYGGWGIKSGKKGKVCNVAGNRGLMLKMKTGRQILIGTGQPEVMMEYLHTIQEFKPA